MNNYNDILEYIRRQFHCPACGKKYEFTDIKIRGSVSSALVVQTVCENGHMTMFVSSLKKLETDMNKKPIITDEVIDLHNSLKNFNGDFSNVWKS